MAATDITYGGLDPVLYTPDFAFLRYTLDKKSAQYQQGLSQAATAYNNLKKDVSDPVNAEKRNQYLKNAEKQIQKIASSDLSLQQNVNFANSIFDPMATDKAFLFDSYHTDRIKKEMTKMDGWRTSQDVEERKKYNPEIQEWLSRDLDSIKNGKGDINNYKGVEGRSAWAYVDPQDILIKAVKDQGFVYKVDDLGSPYIVTTKGGVGGVQNYNVFAENVLANDPVYQQQISILGQARQEKALQVYKQNPLTAGMSDQDIYKLAAKDTWTQNKTSQKSYLETINNNLGKEDAEISAALNGPNSAKYIKGKTDLESGINSQEAQMYNELKQRSERRNSLLEQYNERVKDYNNTYETPDAEKNYIESFSSNPKKYFSDLQFKNDVTRFSNIKAASFERTYKEDRAVVDVMVAKTNALRLANDIQDDIHDNMNADQKLALEERKLNMKGLKTITNPDGTKSVVSKGEADVVFVDADATQITLLDNISKFKDAVETANSRALNSMTGTFGALSMLGAFGMDLPKVGKIRDLYNRYFTNDKQNVKMTPEESKLLTEAMGYIQAFAKNNPSSDFAKLYGNKKSLFVSDLPDLLSHAIKGYDVTTSGNDDLKRAKMGMADYQSAMNDLTVATTALNAGRQAVVTAKLKDPAFTGMFITKKGSDGKDYIDIVDENDIAKMLPTALYIKQNNQRLDNETLKQIGREYVNGSLGVNVSKSSSTTELKLSDGRSFLFLSPNIFYGGVTPKKYQELTKRINSEVQIPQYGDRASGMVAASPFYKLNGSTKQTVLDVLGHITPTNSNIKVYDGTANAADASPKVQKMVRDAIASKDAISEVALMTSSPTNAGGQAVQIKFAVDLKKGDKDHPLAGQSFFFPISPTAASAPIFKVFEKVNEASEFEPYKKNGERFNLDAFKTEGIRAEFIPTSPGSNNGIVRVYQKPFNDVTKKYSDTEVQIGNDFEYDLGNTSFPELKQMVYSDFIVPYVDAKINFVKRNQMASGATGGTGPVTSQSIMNSLLKPRS